MIEHNRNDAFTYLALLDCRCFLDTALFERALLQADSARREKVDGCPTQEDKFLSLGAGLLGDMLLRKHGLEGQLRFESGGKPMLPETGAHISLSHGWHYAMAGISSAALGVDTEVVRPVEWDIVRHFFTPEEQHFLELSRDQESDFWCLWCRKECLIKRDGLKELRQLPAMYPPPDSRFAEYTVDGHICMCLTAEKISPEWHICEIEELL